MQFGLHLQIPTEFQPIFAALIIVSGLVLSQLFGILFFVCLVSNFLVFPMMFVYLYIMQCVLCAPMRIHKSENGH